MNLFRGNKPVETDESSNYNAYLENLVRSEETNRSLEDRNNSNRIDPIFRDENYYFKYQIIKGEATNNEYDDLLTHTLRTTYITSPAEMQLFLKMGETAAHVRRWKGRCDDYYKNVSARIRYLGNLASSKEGFGMRSINRQERVVSIDSRARNVSLVNDKSEMDVARGQ